MLNFEYTRCACLLIRMYFAKRVVQYRFVGPGASDIVLAVVATSLNDNKNICCGCRGKITVILCWKLKRNR